MSPVSRSPQAVRASITDRLNRYATVHGRNIAVVRRRFVIARFLTRDAGPPANLDSQWDNRIQDLVR
ncbi:hypothetical protein MLGJGCBP_04630 [Rhodococcus sp. T7]|nr:hypothetical protein MLGJGCBP_09548 [Rhodococcus sp. T7]KAF0962246.1 hypothetical protein MLGJGCBP_04630 [Rhodococcus sp. T7]